MIITNVDNLSYFKHIYIPSILQEVVEQCCPKLGSSMSVYISYKIEITGILLTSHSFLDLPQNDVTTESPPIYS